MLRLFHHIYQNIILGLYHSVGDLDLVASRAHGSYMALLNMKFKKTPKVYCSQNIPVHNKKRKFLLLLQQTQSACSTQALLLSEITNVHSKRCPITEVILNDMRHVIYRQDNIAQPLRSKTFNNNLQQRPTADTKHWLGTCLGERTQSLP